MKKYFLILICSFAFGQASNQMVTFTQAQSLGFGLNPGQSSVNSTECLTKAQALAKYNLDANSMSAYASNQLVPRSVWVTGPDLQPPSYQFASLNYTGSTCSTLTGTWSGWTDNIGISHYSVFVVNYTTGAVVHTSANLSAATSSYTATGLQGGTLYYYNCRAFDAAGNSAGLTFPYTTPSCVSSYAFNFSNGSTSTTAVCGYGLSITLYSSQSTLSSGSVLYTNSQLTTVYNGLSRWFKGSSGSIYRINSSGQILLVSECI